jgi:hypothetical protein
MRPETYFLIGACLLILLGILNFARHRFSASLVLAAGTIEAGFYFMGGGFLFSHGLMQQLPPWLFTLVFSLARNAPLILLTWAIFHGRQAHHRGQVIASE